MKKALVLGVLAFFAINIASVQNVSAQDKKSNAVKSEKVTKKTVKESKTAAVSTAKTAEAGKEKVVKPANVASQKEAKACCKEEGKEACPQETAPKVGSKAVDPTAKNKTPEIGVPPTPNKTKKSTSSNTTTTQTGTTK